MSISNIQAMQIGIVGVRPGFWLIPTNDTVGTVLTTGYLNQAYAQGYNFQDGDLAAVVTKTSPSSTNSNTGWYQINSSSGSWSLTTNTGPGNVDLPTIANHLAVYTNVTGGLGEDASTAINGGNIQAGLTTGTAGALYSCPGTTTTGRLGLSATASSGAFDVLITNASHGQASTYSISDSGAAAGRLLNAATATPFVSGNFPVASGTGGLMVDSGVAAAQLMRLNAVNTLTGSGQIVLVKANGTESANAVTASGNAGVITTSALTTAGGSSYAITWTNTKITATSAISLCIQGGTNTTQNITFSCVPGAGSATLTIYNNTAATALNGTILIGYTVL